MKILERVKEFLAPPTDDPGVIERRAKKAHIVATLGGVCFLGTTFENMATNFSHDGIDGLIICTSFLVTVGSVIIGDLNIQQLPKAE